MDDTQRPHSAEQFGRQRDFWWRPDFLALLARRLGNTEARSLLDVGTGRCHWAAIVTRWFPGLETLTGVDLEPAWVAGAPAALAEHLGRPPFQAEFRQGSALDLPFADATFDVVTCQTVLMHLADPARALGEMVRVAKPGGLVIASEPANFRAFVDMDSAMLALDLDGMVKRHRLWLACHLGRIALGRGDFNVGDRLLPLMRAAGLVDIDIVMNDKASPLAAPYDDAMLATNEQMDEVDAELHGADRDATLALAVAGGLARDEAEALLGHERECDRLRREQFARGTFTSGGGSQHYVAWGRKAPA